MWVFLGMETIANIKYRSHVDSDSCLLAVCRWLIPHEVAPQQSFTMLQPANAKVIIKNGTTKNNHIYFILQFDPLKHSINNSSCNLTYTPDKYMIVYAYDQRMNAQEEVAAIKAYARKMGYKIVTPGFYHKWADKCVNVSPIELLNWFQHAECVVTDTFHGCVMSIISGREMAVKLRDNANKLLNLMKEYEILERKLDDTMQLEEVFSRKVNWDATNRQVKERRASSMAYLKKMIAL